METDILDDEVEETTANGDVSSNQMQQQQQQASTVLRRRFFDEYRQQIEAGKFAVEDVRRVRTDDSWLLQFLRRCDFDLDVTLPVLIECLKWRHEFGVNRESNSDSIC